MSFAKNFGVGGYREAIVHSSQFDTLIEHLQQALFYTVKHQGKACEQQAGFWQVPQASAIDEALMGPADCDFGLVRVVRIQGADSELIRPAGKPWEAGGIYDLDIRVRDIDQVYARLESLGWTGVHVPFEYAMGPVVVKHCELFGADRVCLALIQRVDPPLGSDAGFDQASNAFNSTQLVDEDELESHDHFYRNMLGFDRFLKTEITWKAPGENIFGLPYNVAMKTPADVRIYHPEGKMAGSVETCALRGLSGEHYGELAKVRNRGVSALRFPVKNLDGYLEKITAAGVKLVQPVVRMTIEPYGETRLFAIRAPAGAHLEFFEET